MEKQNMRKVSTSTLLRRLFKATDLDSFIEENEAELDNTAFHIYITELCHTMGNMPERIIKQAFIERSYGHQLFNGIRKPSRDKVIQLAFGFGLDLDGTQNLLKIAQKNLLYPNIKRDAAIMYCVNRKMNLTETQCILNELDLSLLGGEEKNG